MSTDQENKEKLEPKVAMSNGVGGTFDQLPRKKRLMQPKSTQKVMFGMLASSAALITINGVRGFSFKLIFLSPRNYRYSYRPAIFGTILIIFGAVAIALPLGLAAAIYLTEYAKKGFIVNMINQGISNLAAVPSIVFGVFGYAFFTLALGMNKSLYAGWFTLACMILPTIIRTSEEALKNVPASYREGSYALGVTKWRTIRYIVLPAALPGISTGVILSLGRAAGETAAIMFVGGADLNLGHYLSSFT
ncbi:MAG: phosphate ABC transporter permease PstA [Candidatus Heimdallarchaeota archaeon]